jgi:hypothetical protein
MQHLKAQAICQIVCSLINAEGGHGPCAGEYISPSGKNHDIVAIESQGATVSIRCNPDGTFDLLNPDDIYDEMMEDWGCSEEDMEETREEFAKSHKGMSPEDLFDPGVLLIFGDGSRYEDHAISLIKLIAMEEE